MKILLLVLVCLLSACSPPYQAPNKSNLKCIDGDTFELNGETIRLLAIDTPEIEHGSKSYVQEEELGQLAAETTCQLLTEAKEIKVIKEKGNEKDKYNRSLYWVYLDEVLLQTILVEQGMGTVKYKPKDTKLYNQLLEVESNAKQRRIGIWSK